MESTITSLAVDRPVRLSYPQAGIDSNGLLGAFFHGVFVSATRCWIKRAKFANGHIGYRSTGSLWGFWVFFFSFFFIFFLFPLILPKSAPNGISGQMFFKNFLRNLPPDPPNPRQYASGTLLPAWRMHRDFLLLISNPRSQICSCENVKVNSCSVWHKPGPLLLTHSCLEIYFSSVFWTYQTFGNNFGMKHEFAKYLKKSCRYSSNEQFSFKDFLNIVLVREISPKRSGCFGCNRHGWVNTFMLGVLAKQCCLELWFSDNNFRGKHEFT